MAPRVVTLFEKYGAGARYIGPRVADALGVAWLDQAFSSADIESAKYPGAGAPTEAGSGLARFLGRYAPSATVLDDASIPLAQAQDAVMVEENTSFVKETAEGGTVMLGRNAALIIGDIPNALHAIVGLGPAIFALLGALLFLAYPLTDTRFREIVKELQARHGIRENLGAQPSNQSMSQPRLGTPDPSALPEST